MGVRGRPIRAFAEPMPKTIPSSAAPSTTIKPARIVNRSSLPIASSYRKPLHPLAQNNLLEYFRNNLEPPRKPQEQIYETTCDAFYRCEPCVITRSWVNCLRSP